MSRFGRVGLDFLAAERFASLHGQRLGVLAHAASVDTDYRHLLHHLHATPEIDLKIIFGPEHGFAATAQDLESVTGEPHFHGVPVVSLYGESFESLKPTTEHLSEIDTLLIDLQDVGSRYYTYQATMLFCMAAAAREGKRVVVLDRPNPLGTAIEGPPILPGFESYVGIHSIPTRHGLTIGELARFYQRERKLNLDLTVIPCEPNDSVWVIPSPNMPTRETAWVYPGQCLLEGTNLSEGRGTTRPFELCGAPWIDREQLASTLADLNLPGIRFRPASFRPMFQKHAGSICGGVQLHVTDRESFRPVETGVAVLIALRNQSLEAFHWRTERYEFVEHLPAIDLLFGDRQTRLDIESGATAQEISIRWVPFESEFRERCQSSLLYPRHA